MPPEPPKQRTWKVLESRRVYSAPPWCEIDVQRIRLPDGRIVHDYHWLKLPRYALVVCLDRQDRILFLEGYRHGCRRSTLSLPGGLVNARERVLVAAQRELLEETGYVATDWQRLGAFTPHNNSGAGRAYLFLARNAERQAAAKSGDLEETRVVRLTPAQAFRAVRDGQVATLSSAAALALAFSPAAPDRRKQGSHHESARTSARTRSTKAPRPKPT